MLKFQQFKLAFSVAYIKSKTFIQCFEHAECIAIDTFDVLGNELIECTRDHHDGEP